jgi:hypothetical protein
MSELMEKLLADKLETRKCLVALPFGQKITLMEKIRDRSFLIRHPTVVTVSGDAVGLSAVGAHIVGLTSPAYCQPQDQFHTRQNSRTLLVELRKQPERWLVASVEESEPEFASPSQALLDFHRNQ